MEVRDEVRELDNCEVRGEPIRWKVPRVIDLCTIRSDIAESDRRRNCPMSGPKGSHSGSSMGAREESPARRKRIKKAMVRQEQGWRKKCGPVSTRIATPAEIDAMLSKVGDTTEAKS
jgi:hypothetical protein